jgi:hypothetical protein
VKLLAMALGAATFLFLSGCRSGPDVAVPEPPVHVVAWKQLATWSGRGNMQTETFLSDTGVFRIHWETRNESPRGKGTLRVAFRSGDSGRVIIDAVDQKGVGQGTDEVGDMVRWYYLTIDSANVDWSVTVEEPVMGRSGIRN